MAVMFQVGVSEVHAASTTLHGVSTQKTSTRNKVLCVARSIYPQPYTQPLSSRNTPRQLLATAYLI
jgi:hypothetical protein